MADAQAQAVIDNVLRPTALDDFIGQPDLIGRLRIIINGAKARGEVPCHLLFSGGPGLGKTSIAGVIAAELGTEAHNLFAPNLSKEALLNLLVNLKEGDVVFVDEIHALPRKVEEILYPAMEDFHLDVEVGKGPEAQVFRVQLPRFTLVAATTLPGKTTQALRDRFGFTGEIEYYSVDELAAIVRRSADRLGVAVDLDGAMFISRCSKGTPRTANQLLLRCRDYVQACGYSAIDEVAAQTALRLFGVDGLGLEDFDRKLLQALCTQFLARPVGLVTLAAAVGKDASTIQLVHEPHLIRAGLLEVTAGGRVATPLAFKHLGLGR